MPVLVTNNFDDESIKNERASTGIPFSHYKSMGNDLDALRSQWSDLAEIRTRPRFLCMSSLPTSIKGLDQKQPRKG